ncbi:hypothetical protein B0T10DRAFT_251436 [Thelonectria olida]|uniref:Uncharacterized protein n=1 Tax=Thelonectria olida TaxID=1576542 RepID=A0A9P8WCZ0_9HYPO|nr:hypothetical protein B0T10DRAFT_251436 [Thelonectria olida]
MSSRLTALLRSSATKPSIRPLHTTALSRFAYKDSQDRESLKPRTNEYTRSGHDEDIVNEHPDIAFNPNQPKPEKAASRSFDESNGDPLSMSGANKDVSKGVKQDDAGKETQKGGASKERSSEKKGSPTKD